MLLREESAGTVGRREEGGAGAGDTGSVGLVSCCREDAEDVEGRVGLVDVPGARLFSTSVGDGIGGEFCSENLRAGRREEGRCDAESVGLQSAFEIRREPASGGREEGGI